MKLTRTMWIVFCFLSAAERLQAQGFLPTLTSTGAVHEDLKPVLVKETVPVSLTGIDPNGVKRPLRSYQSALEVLVIVFLSADCPDNQAQWTHFRKMNEKFSSWRVSFLVAHLSPIEALPRTNAALKTERLPWPAVQLDPQSATSILNIKTTPAVVILDEFGGLQYRGPVPEGRQALESIVGHVEAVSHPEPPLQGGCAL